MESIDGTYGVEGWFPDGRDSWRLDAITLLAIIGESEIEAHSQAVCAYLIKNLQHTMAPFAYCELTVVKHGQIEASPLCLLPRLLPAPQALLKPSRPLRMPDYPARVTGVHSGVVLLTVGFFANIITPLDDIPAFGFKVIRVKHRRDEIQTEKSTVTSYEKDDQSRSLALREARRRRRARREAYDDPHRSSSRRNSRRRESSTYLSGPDLEHAGSRVPKARDTEIMDDEPATATTEEQETIPPRRSSPVNIISVISFVVTAVIMGMMVYWKDGVALVAVGVVSLGTSIVGYASYWRPVLLVRARRAGVPAGDVVIQTQHGGFILVKCSDDVARELYAGTPECRYKVGDKTHKLLMALGTAMLMVAIILLGNVGFEGQTMIGASYLLLNMAYWLASMVDKEYFWDMSRYEWSDVTPRDARHASRTTNPDDECDGYKSFTRTLWYVIRETKDTRWARRSGAAQGTQRWKQWLREAEENARLGNRRWAAVRRKDDIFAYAEEDDIEGGFETR